MKYFAAELSLTELFFREREMATYVHGANGTTIGACYTNAQHADDHDMGYTMLPALGSPSRGGHFVLLYTARTDVRSMSSRGTCSL